MELEIANRKRKVNPEEKTKKHSSYTCYHRLPPRIVEIIDDRREWGTLNGDFFLFPTLVHPSYVISKIRAAPSLFLFNYQNLFDIVVLVQVDFDLIRLF